MREANQTELKMARAILEACKINQESYDKDAADQATAADEDARAAFVPQHSLDIYFTTVDYSKFYRIGLEEACEQACDLFGMAGVGRVIYLALYGWWNDTREWAKRVLDPTATCVPTLKHCQHGVEYKSTCQCCIVHYEATKDAA